MKLRSAPCKVPEEMRGLTKAASLREVEKAWCILELWKGVCLLQKLLAAKSHTQGVHQHFAQSRVDIACFARSLEPSASSRVIATHPMCC